MTTADLIDPILTADTRLPGVRLVTIDGPAGAGKTTLAADLAERLRARGASVETVHLDDLYDGWDGLDERLTEHLSEWIVTPLANGRPARHPVYDWSAGAFGSWRDVPPADVVIIEGVGAGQPVVADVATLRIWADAPPHVRRKRDLARGAAGVAGRWDEWARREAGHFARSRARERADVIVTA